jgi:hypothetical protein
LFVGLSTENAPCIWYHIRPALFFDTQSVLVFADCVQQAVCCVYQLTVLFLCCRLRYGACSSQSCGRASAICKLAQMWASSNTFWLDCCTPRLWWQVQYLTVVLRLCQLLTLGVCRLSGLIVNTKFLLLCGLYVIIQGDQEVSAHLMITTQKLTSNVQNVLRQSPDWQPTTMARGTIHTHTHTHTNVICYP